MNVSLSKIMKNAWRMYRARRAGLADWQIARRPDEFSFSSALKKAWQREKNEVAMQSKLDSLSESENNRLSALLNARDAAKYLPSHMNASRRINEINEQIKALVGFYL